MKGKSLASAGFVVFLVMFFSFHVCAEEKLASSIKAYMGISPDLNVVVADFIEKKLGVQVKQHFMSFGEIGAKLAAEAPRFSADMCIGTGSPQAFRAKKEGWSIPYASLPWQGAGEVWVDSDNHWFNFGNFSFVLVGNKELLAKKGYTMPESWDDVLDPKWKGQIVMPSPLTSGTAYMMLYSFMTLYGINADKGEEGGWEFLAALDKNINHYTRGGDAPTELVSRGEFMLGITADSQVAARIKEGYPLVWTVPKGGTGYEGNYAFMLKGTKEEYTCQKIIDLVATKEFCELFGKTGNVTKDPTVYNELYKAVPSYIPNIDLGWAAENRPRLSTEWKDRFLRK